MYRDVSELDIIYYALKMTTSIPIFLNVGLTEQTKRMNETYFESSYLDVNDN
jgi:hypothetical protein